MKLGQTLADDLVRKQAFDWLRAGAGSPDGDPFPERLVELAEELRGAGLLDRFADIWKIIDVTRPMLPIRKGSFPLPDLPALREPLAAAHPTLETATLSVGRLEVDGSRNLAGTGWVVAHAERRGLVVTNRHVVKKHFGTQVGERFQISVIGERQVTVMLELRDGGNGHSLKLPVTDILHVDPAFDLAVLQLGESDLVPDGIPLGAVPEPDQPVSVVGFPTNDADDDRDDILLLGRPFGRKTLAPGYVKSRDADRITHDASTTAGFSGAPVLAMDGSVVGVHFEGYKDRYNAAVAVERLRACLAVAVS